MNVSSEEYFNRAFVDMRIFSLIFLKAIDVNVTRLVVEEVDIIAPDLLTPESQATSVKSESVQKPVVTDILHF